MAGETAQDLNRTLDEIDKGIKRIGSNQEVRIAARMLLEHIDGVGPASFLPIELFIEKLREALKRAGR